MTEVDLNGDGKNETLVLTNTLIAYDESNKELITSIIRSSDSNQIIAEKLCDVYVRMKTY